MRWADIWRMRTERHWLRNPASAEAICQVVGTLCGIHAQVASSAELSLGLRVEGISRQDLRRALWTDRTLVKTIGPRSTLHIFAATELPLWLAALRTKTPPRDPTPAEREALSQPQREQIVRAIYDAVDNQPLTRDELDTQIARRVGGWATQGVFPAFGGSWPRWQLALSAALLQGLIVHGPNRGARVTYVRTDQWLGKLPDVDGRAALREVAQRYFSAYGPATHAELARWLGTRPSAARQLMAELDLEEVEVEGWRAWVHREAANAATIQTRQQRSVRLLPPFDCYVVGCFPRAQLIPEVAPAALQRGTAAPFAVVLIDGTVGGVWERRRRGNVLQLRIDNFERLSPSQRDEVERDAQRIGEVLETRVALEFGPVDPRRHL